MSILHQMNDLLGLDPLDRADLSVAATPASPSFSRKPAIEEEATRGFGGDLKHHSSRPAWVARA